MASADNVFSPSPSGTMTLAASSTSASVTLAGASGGTVVITNKGPNTAFIRFGGSSNTALLPGGSAGDYPVLAGTKETLERGDTTTMAAICASTETATLWVSTGQGA